MADATNVKMGVSGVAEFKRGMNDAKEAVKFLASKI